MQEAGESAQGSRDGRLFEALFEQALDAVLIADDDRYFVDANPAASDLIGLSRESMIGRRVEDFFEVLENQPVPEAWRKFQQDGTQAGVCRVNRPDKSIRYVGFRAKANFWPSLHLSILRDITDHRAAEEALAALNWQLRDANKELARSNAELSHFAYGVGHDLQAPLRTIAALSKKLALKTSDSDPNVVEHVSEINQVIEGINTFLEDILNFAQVGRTSQSFRLIDSEAVLHFARAGLRSSIDDNHALISHDPLPQLYGDERQLTQLFQNLIGNSLKYRGASPPRIHISAIRDGDEWVFSVSDNGPGIPSDRHSIIFEMFKRLHGNEIPGRGLGLALCKRIVENYGGRIWVECETETGSTFRFTLPATSKLAESI